MNTRKRSVFMILLWGFLLLAFLPGMSCADSIYDRVKDTGIIKIGLLRDNVPLGFLDDKNDWKGFEVDLADEIAKYIGVSLGKLLKVVRVRVDIISRVEFAKNGQVDMSVAGITHTKEREKYLDFSIPYFFDGQSILARKGQYKTIKDIIGKRLAVIQGTTNELNLIKLLSGFNVKDYRKHILSFQDESFCFMALDQGRVAGWTADSILLLGFAAKAPGKYELVGEQFSVEPYAIGLPKNDIKWKNTVDQAIKDMWRDGVYKSIYDKWFGHNSKYYLPMNGAIVP